MQLPGAQPHQRGDRACSTASPTPTRSKSSSPCRPTHASTDACSRFSSRLLPQSAVISQSRYRARNAAMNTTADRRTTPPRLDQPTRAGPASPARTPPRTWCACAAPCRSSIRSRKLGAEKLWSSLHSEDFVNALGALTGNQAMQQVKAGLKAIYLSRLAGRGRRQPRRRDVSRTSRCTRPTRCRRWSSASTTRCCAPTSCTTRKATTTSTSCSRSWPMPKPVSAACSTPSS